MFERGGQGEEENLAARLVDRIAEGRVHDPSRGCRPQRPGQKNENPGAAEGDREDQEGETDPEEPVDPAHQPDLNDKARRRKVELNLGEEGRDRICSLDSRSS